MRELLPVLISVILFIVTMVIVATLRKSDQNKMKMEHIKKYVNHFSEKMQQSGEEIQTKVVEIESKIYKIQQDTAVTVTKIHGEKEELFSHLQDLEELQSTVLQYHSVLTSLSDMTESVENRLINVKEDINEIKKVEHLISEFFTSIEESRESMDQMQQSLHQSFGIYHSKIESLIDSSTDKLALSFDEKRDAFSASVDPLLVKIHSLTSSLLSEVDTQVERVQHQIAFLHQATSLSLADVKQYVHDGEKEYAAQQETLMHLIQEREALSRDIQKLGEEKGIAHTQLTAIQEEKKISLGELQQAIANVATSMDEIDTIHKEVQSSKDELLSLEDEIAEALRIKEQLEKEKEIASLLEREKVDYPTFDEEEGEDLHPEVVEESINQHEDPSRELFETIEVEVERELDKEDMYEEKELELNNQEDNLHLYEEDNDDDQSEDEIELDEEESENDDDKTKKKNIIEHNQSVHDKEEDELEISLDEDDEYN